MILTNITLSPLITKDMQLIVALTALTPYLASTNTNHCAMNANRHVTTDSHVRVEHAIADDNPNRIVADTRHILGQLSFRNEGRAHSRDAGQGLSILGRFHSNLPEFGRPIPTQFGSTSASFGPPGSECFLSRVASSAPTQTHPEEVALPHPADVLLRHEPPDDELHRGPRDGAVRQAGHPERRSRRELPCPRQVPRLGLAGLRRGPLLRPCADACEVLRLALARAAEDRPGRALIHGPRPLGRLPILLGAHDGGR